MKKFKKIIIIIIIIVVVVVVIIIIIIIIIRIAYAYVMRVINYNSTKSKLWGYVCYIGCEVCKAEIRWECGEPMTDLAGFFFLTALRLMILLML